MIEVMLAATGWGLANLSQIVRSHGDECDTPFRATC